MAIKSNLYFVALIIVFVTFSGR